MLILASPSRPGESADKSRLVLIGDIDHRFSKFGVDADTLDIDQPRLAVGIDRAGNPNVTCICSVVTVNRNQLS